MGASFDPILEQLPPIVNASVYPDKVSPAARLRGRPRVSADVGAPEIPATDRASPTTACFSPATEAVVTMAPPPAPRGAISLARFRRSGDLAGRGVRVRSRRGRSLRRSAVPAT